MKYKVPFVNYPRHYERIKHLVMPAVERCLMQGDLILRKDTETFEENLAKFIGVKHAIGLNSGTDAIQLSLEAVGINKGDEVITTAHTFVATIAAIRHLGAKPVLADIEERTMNISTRSVEKLITPETKAIIPVHLNGRMCDMKRLLEISKDIPIIEDAAQALGADQRREPAGSIGITGCFSFYPAKILGAAGDGGAIVTNNDEIAEMIRSLRDHCVDRRTKEITGYGYNSRLDNIQAAILNVKLRYLYEWIIRRREIAEQYHRGLKGLPIKLPPKPTENGEYYDVYQNYVIRTKPKERDKLEEYLDHNGIETMVSWRKPLHKHPALELTHYRLPVTEKVSETALSIPIYPELTDDEVETVIHTIRDYYDKTH